jgi:hypothetical protein
MLRNCIWILVMAALLLSSGCTPQPDDPLGKAAVKAT